MCFRPSSCPSNYSFRDFRNLSSIDGAGIGGITKADKLIMSKIQIITGSEIIHLQFPWEAEEVEKITGQNTSHKGDHNTTGNDGTLTVHPTYKFQTLTSLAAR
jgi:hypothetical protein